MAKLNLRATDDSRKPTKYSEFTRSYRQSENVVDNRDGNGSDRAKRGVYGEYSGRTYDTSRPSKNDLNPNGYDEYPARKHRDTSTTPDSQKGGDDGATGYDYHSTTSSTRKVSPEEAIQVTHKDRK